MEEDRAPSYTLLQKEGSSQRSSCTVNWLLACLQVPIWGGSQRTSVLQPPPHTPHHHMASSSSSSYRGLADSLIGDRLFEEFLSLRRKNQLVPDKTLALM